MLQFRSIDKIGFGLQQKEAWDLPLLWSLFFSKNGKQL